MNMYTIALLFLLQLPFACNEPVGQPPCIAATDSVLMLSCIKPVAETTVLRSIDAGQTWQNISEGLPVFEGDISFIARGNGLYLLAGRELFHSQPNAAASNWTKEVLPDRYQSIALGQNGIYAFNANGSLVHKPDAMVAWSPVCENFQQESIRTVYENVGGTVFLGTDDGLFKSDDRGQQWKQVYNGGWVMKIVESDGILLATSQGGILRSTDEGENWDYILREGGVGIDVACIRGGYAVINYNPASSSRRIRTSYDGGTTWQPIDTGLTPSLSISSIVETGGYFFCGHPEGIFRSSDKGKTWQLLLPSIGKKVFNVVVSGDVIYAIPLDGGC